jgi:hypothetical protein
MSSYSQKQYQDIINTQKVLAPLSYEDFVRTLMAFGKTWYDVAGNVLQGKKDDFALWAARRERAEEVVAWVSNNIQTPLVITPSERAAHLGHMFNLLRANPDSIPGGVGGMQDLLREIFTELEDIDKVDFLSAVRHEGKVFAIRKGFWVLGQHYPSPTINECFRIADALLRSY